MKMKFPVYFFAVTFFALFIYFVCHKKPMFTHYDGIPLRGLDQFNLPIIDLHGNYLYMDEDLNMALLLHMDLPENERNKIIRNHFPMEITNIKSVIFKETAHEITIDAEADSLVIINNSSGAKKIIQLNFNFYKENRLKLIIKYRAAGVDLQKYNLFQDIIEILPDHAAEINEVYLGAKGDQPGHP